MLQVGFPKRKTSETAICMQEVCRGVLLGSYLWERKRWHGTEGNWSVISHNKPLSRSHGELGSWNGPTELFQTGAWGWAFILLYQQYGLSQVEEVSPWVRWHSAEGSLWLKMPLQAISCQLPTTWGVSVLVLEEESGQHTTECTTVCYINKGHTLNYMGGTTIFWRLHKTIGNKVNSRANHLTRWVLLVSGFKDKLFR